MSKIHHISNGNKAFSVDNAIERGTWGSATLAAMLLAGSGRAEIDVRVHGHHARFTQSQLRSIAEGLLELADEMKEHDK